MNKREKEILFFFSSTGSLYTRIPFNSKTESCIGQIVGGILKRVSKPLRCILTGNCSDKMCPDADRFNFFHNQNEEVIYFGDFKSDILRDFDGKKGNVIILTAVNSSKLKYKS